MILPAAVETGQRKPEKQVEAESRGHLEEILKSGTFEKSETLRALVSYLFEHRGRPVSEYALATEALGKKPDFEPKTDASVRVRISRLRQKLDEFYRTEGLGSAVRFSIPLGGHELCIGHLDPPRAERPAPARSNVPLWTLAGAVVLLSVLYVGALISKHELQAQVAARSDQQDLPEFWSAFFSNGKPASLFVSTPVFFSTPRAEFGATNSVVIRDTGINDFSNRNRSQALAWFSQKFGEPALLENYTVASDTFAALQLVSYLQPQKVQLAVGGTAEMSVESAGNQNILLIGTAGTSHQVSELLEYAPFYVADGETLTVRNRDPRNSEPKSFETVKESSIRWITPGIIAVLPGRVPNTRVLVLTGYYTYPLVYSLSTPSPLAAIHSQWRKIGRPTFFEAVIKAEVESKGASVLRISVAAFRKLEPHPGQ